MAVEFLLYCNHLNQYIFSYGFVFNLYMYSFNIAGCKWTLKQLRRYFHRAKIEDWLLWKKISSLIILTLFSHVSHIPPTVNCFEFFGFDVLIDSSLKPWLLEVLKLEL